eukprot:354196-Chlamydomonas_euryale.AAC.7
MALCFLLVIPLMSGVGGGPLVRVSSHRYGTPRESSPCLSVCTGGTFNNFTKSLSTLSACGVASPSCLRSNSCCKFDVSSDKSGALHDGSGTSESRWFHASSKSKLSDLSMTGCARENHLRCPLQSLFCVARQIKRAACARWDNFGDGALHAPDGIILVIARCMRRRRDFRQSRHKGVCENTKFSTRAHLVQDMGFPVVAVHAYRRLCLARR